MDMAGNSKFIYIRKTDLSVWDTHLSPTQYTFALLMSSTDQVIVWWERGSIQSYHIPCYNTKSHCIIPNLKSTYYNNFPLVKEEASVSGCEDGFERTQTRDSGKVEYQDQAKNLIENRRQGREWAKKIHRF